MSSGIIIEHTIDEAIILDQTELWGMIRLEQSGVKEGGEKRSISEQIKNIMEKRRDVPNEKRKV